jgi:hypothetical protein
VDCESSRKLGTASVIAMSPTLSTPPPEKQIKARCLTCKRDTAHRIFADFRDYNREENGCWIDKHFQIIGCLGCDTYSFRQTLNDNIFSEEEEPLEELWPPRKVRAAVDHQFRLPKGVIRVYVETNKALNNDQRILGAIGIRALVEAVCKHKRAKGRNLKFRIDNLVTRGVLTKGQARVLHQTRFMGNKAAHETKPPSKEVLEYAMQIAEHMLTAVYLLPMIGKDMRKTRVSGRTYPDTGSRYAAGETTRP